MYLKKNLSFCVSGCLRAKTRPGLEQYAIKKFAEAFEAVPRALAENSGVKANELISKLYAEHHSGNKNIGFDIEVRLYTSHNETAPFFPR